MKLLKEFKEFAVKGNMMDMAIGVIIGASFNKVIDVLVKFVLMPPLSLLTDDVNFDNKKLILREAITDASGAIITSEVAIGYGALITVLIDFLVIGFTVFLVVKGMNRLRTRAHDSKDKTVTTPKDIQLLSDLKELMEAQNKMLKSNMKN
ncbi:large conductance mechanosensitive channel protein MscL [Winogradskyella pacifica]|uniref:Large-conductance mechanosensitive channel n=1 Tax=Winogradskyella pacifica TaxID=664642 RepID=A0A3D9N4U4_9FLAO|nr:large conductance mechanosensitive channel protein MscL [Winogradskyella pacifica]REE25071.1 large conductance mechanosensitive channel [Winogradskyella pacifica]